VHPEGVLGISSWGGLVSQSWLDIYYIYFYRGFGKKCYSGLYFKALQYFWNAVSALEQKLELKLE